ncbi:MAG TPA: GNAT family N-acetyltransferase [Actinoplanes sp.]|nr:GNAT family N-acetyltransferase [Actinoplanes sp.]
MRGHLSAVRPGHGGEFRDQPAHRRRDGGPHPRDVPLPRWLVAETGGDVVGYAYARPFAAREAYRWSCETSIYLSPGRRRSGLGRALYTALLARLTERGFRVAVAKMTLPNAASEGLHAALGFRPVGVHPRIGFKNGAWHDIAIAQLTLATGDDPPTDPR